MKISQKKRQYLNQLKEKKGNSICYVLDNFSRQSILHILSLPFACALNMAAKIWHILLYI